MAKTKTAKPKVDSRSAKRTPKKKAAKTTGPEPVPARARQQDLIEDAFPDRVDRLEDLAVRWISLGEKKKKLSEQIAEARQEIALAMKDEDLEHYKCYTCRMELVRKVLNVSLRHVPEKEATPFESA